jgi:D-alanyl-D-alanine dipeptidase
MRRAAAAVAAGAMLLPLCGCATRANGGYYYENHSFRNFDIRSLHGNKEDATLTDTGVLSLVSSGNVAAGLPAKTAQEVFYRATVADKMLNVYVSPTLSSRVAMTLAVGEEIELAYYNKDFLQIKKDGVLLGYCEAGHAYSGVWDNYFAFLPEESGMAKNKDSELVPATSKLVDVRLYTDKLKIKMKLATNGTTIGEPFYQRNLCLLQEDTLMKLLKAVEMFEADGYTVVIYDAYRPTSVQQRWFDVVRVHKWVADPSIGMGGIHDRGVAVDMTLMDTKTGVELDMPTAMHTFTDAASRWATMTTEQRKNVDYMTKIMVECGFTYINSEWWHFQDSLAENYLPTDHPIDEIPLVYMERSGS